jgi:CTP-dependent riboflavin kinase
MPYPIWISTDSHGTPRIGADLILADDTCDAERIYSSQMANRCTARTAEGRVVICTPTEAQERGLEIIARFPRADGSLKRR